MVYVFETVDSYDLEPYFASPSGNDCDDTDPRRSRYGFDPDDSNPDVKDVAADPALDLLLLAP